MEVGNITLLAWYSFADSTGVDPDILRIIGIFGLRGDLNGRRETGKSASA